MLPSMKVLILRLKSQFRLWFVAGLCLSLLVSCLGGVPSVDSPESAEEVLLKLVPKIDQQEAFITDDVASRYSVDGISEPLPDVEDFPLHGATPSTDPQSVYIEIFSSSEKANIEKQNERWLVDVADAFNQKEAKTASGKTIRVGIRQIPSGTAARLLAAGRVQPTGYSPSNDLWTKLIESDGVATVAIAPSLVPNVAGFVVQDSAYQALSANGPVTFAQIVDATLSGNLTVGYPNPYTSSTSLNLLYSLFWRAAGHQENGQPLTTADLQSPAVNSVFSAFQEQVLITTTTTLDLQELFIREPDKLQAFPLEYQNYVTLKQLSGFEAVKFVPFGIPHSNPLVGFAWNSPEQQEALKAFGTFATAPEMQTLAVSQGFEPIDYFKKPDVPLPTSGDVLKAAQSYWKAQKDGGRTVYLMAVVDTSGSMDGDPLRAVQEGLKVASANINAGNQIGLVTFGDNVSYRLPLAPFDKLQHQRLLAAIDSLQADGSTAMYDGTLVGLAELVKKRQADPNGQFYLLLLTDGAANRGYTFADVENLLEYSGIRIYPIAYGDVNQAELDAIAQLRESNVKQGNPANVQELLKGIFQTNL